MYKYSYSPLPSSASSMAVQMFWRTVAFSLVILLITFWIGTFHPHNPQENFNFQDLDQIIELIDPLLVVSPCGTFNGSYETNVYGTSRVWKGIKYGESPERFAAPKPVKPLPPTKINQNYNSPGCAQEAKGGGTYFYVIPDAWMSEDCLYLEVHAPLAPSDDESNGYPVVVMLTPGALRWALEFQYSSYDMSSFSRKGVISVVPNWRQGIFGTFAMGNVSGNFGLQDQRLALKWVQQNIAAFGGDPKRVTILGTAAGGLAVSAHLASPYSSGLYSAAIISGAPIGIRYPTLDQAKAAFANISRSAGCEDEDIDCMRKVPYEMLSAIPSSDVAFSAASLTNGIYFVDPRGDVPIQPYEAIQSGQYPDVPLLASFTRDESLGMMYASSKNFTRDEYPAHVSYFANYYMYVDNKTWASSELQQLYPYTAHVTDGRPLLSEIATDGLIVCPILDMLEGAVAKGKPPIHVFEFAYAFSRVEESRISPAHDEVPHGADALCYLEVPSVSSDFSASDKQLCGTLNSAVTNFLQNRDPNIGRPLLPSMHFPLLKTSGDVLIVDKESTAGKYSRYDICEIFWNKVQPFPETESA